MSIISNFKALLGAAVLFFNTNQDKSTLLTEEIKRNCSITENIKVQSHSHFGIVWHRPSILQDCQLCGSLVNYVWPNFNHQGTHIIGQAAPGTWEYKLGELNKIAALYHEMGHIAHRDEAKYEQLKSKIARHNTRWSRFFRETYHANEELPEYLALLHEVDFVQDIRRVQNYIDRAKNLFSKAANFTILGTYVSKILREQELLWKAPQCNVCFHEKKYKRGKESRADLFAADKMWLNGRVDVLIAIAYLHASSEYIVAEEKDIHPSGIERALMFIGFLDEKGVNVQALIEDFEKNPIEEIHEHKREYLLTQVKDELIAEHWAHHQMYANISKACAACNH